MTRWIAHGTHKGTWMGIAATGKPVRFGGINIYTIGHGLFTESQVTWDMLSVFRQIGAVSVTLEAPGRGAGAS